MTSRKTLPLLLSVALAFAGCTEINTVPSGGGTTTSSAPKEKDAQSPDAYLSSGNRTGPLAVGLHFEAKDSIDCTLKTVLVNILPNSVNPASYFSYFAGSGVEVGAGVRTAHDPNIHVLGVVDTREDFVQVGQSFRLALDISFSGETSFDAFWVASNLSADPNSLDRGLSIALICNGAFQLSNLEVGTEVSLFVDTALDGGIGMSHSAVAAMTIAGGSQVIMAGPQVRMTAIGNGVGALRLTTPDTERQWVLSAEHPIQASSGPGVYDLQLTGLAGGSAIGLGPIVFGGLASLQSVPSLVQLQKVMEGSTSAT